MLHADATTSACTPRNTHPKSSTIYTHTRKRKILPPPFAQLKDNSQVIGHYVAVTVSYRVDYWFIGYTLGFDKI